MSTFVPVKQISKDRKISNSRSFYVKCLVFPGFRSRRASCDHELSVITELKNNTEEESQRRKGTKKVDEFRIAQTRDAVEQRYVSKKAVTFSGSHLRTKVFQLLCKN